MKKIKAFMLSLALTAVIALLIVPIAAVLGTEGSAVGDTSVVSANADTTAGAKLFETILTEVDFEAEDLKDFSVSSTDNKNITADLQAATTNTTGVTYSTAEKDGNTFLRFSRTGSGGNPTIKRTNLYNSLKEAVGFTFSFDLAKDADTAVAPFILKMVGDKPGTTRYEAHFLTLRGSGDLVFSSDTSKKVTTLTEEFQKIKIEVDFSEKTVTAFVNGEKIGTEPVDWIGDDADAEWKSVFNANRYNFECYGNNKTALGNYLIDNIKIASLTRIPELSSNTVFLSSSFTEAQEFPESTTYRLPLAGEYENKGSYNFIVKPAGATGVAIVQYNNNGYALNFVRDTSGATPEIMLTNSNVAIYNNLLTKMDGTSNINFRISLAKTESEKTPAMLGQIRGSSGSNMATVFKTDEDGNVFIGGSTVAVGQITDTMQIFDFSVNIATGNVNVFANGIFVGKGEIVFPSATAYDTADEFFASGAVQSIFTVRTTGQTWTESSSVYIGDMSVHYTKPSYIGGIKLTDIESIYTPFREFKAYAQNLAGKIEDLTGKAPAVIVGGDKPTEKFIELGSSDPKDERMSGVAVNEALFSANAENSTVFVNSLVYKNTMLDFFTNNIIGNDTYAESLNEKISFETVSEMEINKTAFADPSFERAEWLSLNGKWYFSKTNPSYDGTINVPYSWESPLSENKQLGKGTGHYLRGAEWDPEGERIFIVFGAVDYSCEVFVNGKSVGTHKGGYSKFEFDVTDVWLRDGENIIEVAATDTEESTQVSGKQGYGQIRGIWQNVWLEARPENYISSFFVTTLMDGSVTYEVEVNGEDGGTVGFTGRTESATVEGGKATLSFKVENPTLWEQDNPHLYYGNLTLTYGGEVDSVSTYFGIREIGTAKFGDVYYITLNGKPVYLNGILDQGFNADGYFTVPTDKYCEDEITRLKDLGYNMIRYHAKAPEPLQLYYADKMGMLVMEDIIWIRYRPDEAGQAQFEKEMEDQIIRDRNHPSLFYWVVFNESWGLYTKEETSSNIPASSYDWVVKCYNRAKELDPTRLIEDNSTVNKNHTTTDVNTWHMYVNTYDATKERIEEFVNNSYPGSSYNYTEGYTMGNVPVMNSECGNTWGVTGGIGESDISWHYRYMINEFRRHSLLNGFVFTEYRDVPNEFNGIYKLNGDLKDTGYSLYGISVNDLHSADYVGAVYSPMSTASAGSSLSIPMFFSSFTDKRHGKELTLQFELVIFDPVGGDYKSVLATKTVTVNSYGTTALEDFELTLPEFDGVAELLWTLYDGEERITGNFLLFDVQSERDDALEIEPADMTAAGFTTTVNAIKNSKVSGIGQGSFSINISSSDIPNLTNAQIIRLLFEASTREPMAHDFEGGELPPMDELDYVLNGYTVDPGTNPNSFRQTDSKQYPGKISIYLDGVKIGEATLADCPADSRGALSHHYQPIAHLLDEAGSYGYLVDIAIPAEMISGKSDFTLTFTADEDSGLSIFGRNCGRYGIGVLLIADGVDSGEVLAQTLKPTGINIALSDDIRMGFYVPKTALEGYENPVLKFNFEGVNYEISPNNETLTVNGVTCYVFRTPKFSPHLAASTLTYALFATKDGTKVYGPSGVTSIESYCYRALERTEEQFTEELKNLIADTLNYCAAAETYILGKTEDLANEGLSAYPDYGTKTEPEIGDTGYTNTVKEGYTGDKITGIAVSLNNGIRMRVSNPEGLKIVVKDGDGKVLRTITEFANEDGVHIAYFKSSSAADLRKLYTFELQTNDGAVVQTLANFSFETYAYSAINNTAAPESIKTLMRAMMTYCDSAVVYKDTL